MLRTPTHGFTFGLALSLAAGGATFALPAMAADSFTLKDKPKIAMLYFGPKNDGGWTQAFDEARAKVEKEIGQKIQFVENVPEDASAIKPAAEKFIQRGANIVIGTAFGYSDSFKDLAAKYPGVAFLNGSGTTNGSNLESFYGRTYESQYLCGMAAGAASKTGKLGFVAANPFGVVNWTINAFALGAQKMNPNATVNVIYTGAWNDPVKERAAAAALIDQGADVIMQHTDSPAAMQIASERGKLAFGQDSEMIKFGPKTQLTSILDTWGPYYIERVKAELAGTWKSEDTWGGLDSHMFAMAPYTNMPDDVKKLAEDAEAKIKSGELKPFTGPLKKQDGSEWLAAGATSDDGTLLGMNFYVEGVDDQLPK